MATDPSSDNDPTRRLIRQVLGAVSQFEKRVIVLKLRTSRREVHWALNWSA